MAKDKDTYEPTDQEFAAQELRGTGSPPASIATAFAPALWDKWVEQVKSDPRYRMPDPDDPEAGGSTGSGGWNPPPTLIVEYGDGPHDYIATDFDAGQVIVRDGNDPTGHAWKFPEAGWRRFVAKVRGEKLDDEDLDEPEGDSMTEGARKLAARTAQRMKADEKATQAAAKGGRTAK